MWTFWNKYQATFPSPHPHPTPINLFDLFGWQERSCRVCRSVTSIRFIHLFLIYWGGGRLCGDAMLSSRATPMVSFRQLTVQPVIRMSSEWRPFRFQWASKNSSDSGAMCAENEISLSLWLLSVWPADLIVVFLHVIIILGYVRLFDLIYVGQ